MHSSWGIYSLLSGTPEALGHSRWAAGLHPPHKTCPVPATSAAPLSRMLSAARWYASPETTHLHEETKSRSSLKEPGDFPCIPSAPQTKATNQNNDLALEWRKTGACSPLPGKAGWNSQIHLGINRLYRKALLFPFNLISTASQSSSSPWMLYRVQPTAHTAQTNPAWAQWAVWPGSAASSKNPSLVQVGQKESCQGRGSQQPHAGTAHFCHCWGERWVSSPTVQWWNPSSSTFFSLLI